jgi:hypothetical protein
MAGEIVEKKPKTGGSSSGRDPVRAAIACSIAASDSFGLQRPLLPKCRTVIQEGMAVFLS